MARKLLLADDSITIQKVVELVLAEEGFEIKAVNNGEEALTVAAAFKPDIVLADIEMPKMNGYQLCEKLKDNPATRNVPVILLSGAFEPLDEELARQVKADSFVVKPFESQELISKINASLMSASEAGQAVMPVEAEEEGIVAEAVGAEEELWAAEAMEAAEEVPAETTGIEVPLEEEGAIAAALAEPEGEGIAEAFEPEGEAVEAEAVMAEEIETPVPPPGFESQRPVFQQRELRTPEMTMPSTQEMSAIFRKTVDDRVASSLAEIDVKSAILTSITPLLKDSIEKVLWEVAPELTEKLLREMLQTSLASVNKEIEKIIWETVPDITERMIAREIEKIKSES